MIFDYLRTCYTTQARLHSYDSATEEIRWFRAKADAKVFPADHAFGSLVWEGEYLQVFQGPGETTRVRKWVKCRNPGCTGDHIPSDLVRFLHGLTLAEVLGPPLEPCCSGSFRHYRFRSILVFEANYLARGKTRSHGRLALKANFSSETTAQRSYSAVLNFSASADWEVDGGAEGGTVIAWLPEVSTLKLFNVILSDIGTVTIHLFTSVTGGGVDQDTVLADFVECSYAAYAPQPAVIETLIPSPLTTNTLTYEALTWLGPNQPPPDPINGWYATWTDGMLVEHLLMAADFPASIILGTSDDELTLSIDWQDFDAQHP